MNDFPSALSINVPCIRGNFTCHWNRSRGCVMTASRGWVDPTLVQALLSNRPVCKQRHTFASAIKTHRQPSLITTHSLLRLFTAHIYHPQRPPFSPASALVSHHHPLPSQCSRPNASVKNSKKRSKSYHQASISSAPMTSANGSSTSVCSTTTQFTKIKSSG